MNQEYWAALAGGLLIGLAAAFDVAALRPDYGQQRHLGRRV